MSIKDSRTESVRRLCDIAPMGFFIWKDDVYRRVETTIEADLRYRSGTVPAIRQRSGKLVLIDQDAIVMPCRCEMTIIE